MTSVTTVLRALDRAERVNLLLALKLRSDYMAGKVGPNVALRRAREIARAKTP
jgi:hypothetical protein